MLKIVPLQTDQRPVLGIETKVVGSTLYVLAGNTIRALLEPFSK